MATSERMGDGGPAFPVPNDANVNGQEGMTLREHFAANAPIDSHAAGAAYGGPIDWHSDSDRAAFFAVWAMLRFEYADAMLAARSPVASGCA